MELCKVFRASLSEYSERFELALRAPAARPSDVDAETRFVGVRYRSSSPATSLRRGDAKGGMPAFLSSFSIMHESVSAERMGIVLGVWSGQKSSCRLDWERARVCRRNLAHHGLAKADGRNEVTEGCGQVVHRDAADDVCRIFVPVPRGMQVSGNDGRATTDSICLAILLVCLPTGRCSASRCMVYRRDGPSYRCCYFVPFRETVLLPCCATSRSATSDM